MLLEADVRKQTRFSVSFGGLGYRKAGDIAMPSFRASMNSVGELVGTNFSRINIADTHELAEAVESWRGASGGASLLDDSRWQNAWDLPIVKGNWDNVLCEADHVPIARLAQCFIGFVAWDNTDLLKNFRVAIALRVGTGS